MTNVPALNRVLPAIGIQSDALAQINGTVTDNKLTLLVPPAGWFYPAVSVKDMLAFALIDAGRGRPEANGIAAEMADTFLAGQPSERRPIMLNDVGAEMVVCASVADCLDLISGLGRREAEVATVLGRLAEEAANTRLFQSGELGQNARSLRELGSEPLQSGLTEFWPCIESLALCLFNDDEKAEGQLQGWMKDVRPKIEALEGAVGTKLFHFKEPDDDHDDDEGHRFLALDCICHLFPDSIFVNYLREVSSASSVKALRMALRAPESYSPDFRLYDSFHRPEVSSRLNLVMPALGDAPG